jgi:hypothetical protein
VTSRALDADRSDSVCRGGILELGWAEFAASWFWDRLGSGWRKVWDVWGQGLVARGCL